MSLERSMANLAVIPARSGSKGLPDKNIRHLRGKPLMAYTIEAALESGVFDEVMVSTDSKHYAEIAREFGASVPFLRSAVQSSDVADSWSVVAEVLDGYARMGVSFKTVCLLQPTSPLRTAEDIVGAYGLFGKAGSLPVASVCEAEHPPLWCMRITGNYRIKEFVGGGEMGRRQDCGRFYRLNGAIYIVDVERFKEGGFGYDKGGYAYVMSQERSVDIDGELDFSLAEIILGRVAH